MLTRNRAFLIGIYLASWSSVWAFSHDSQEMLTPIEINRRDLAAQQRGAATFFQYCAGCHSLKHIRYTDIAHHFGWEDAHGSVDSEMIFEYLNFINDNPASPVLTSLNPKDAEIWFGKVPPDLSLITRSRSPEWIQAMLLGFYSDPSAEKGVGNVQFPSGIAMPHVLVEREEWAPLAQLSNQAGDSKPALLHNQSEERYKKVVSDLIHFLDYVAEPHRLYRETIGKYVILFLIALSCINYLFYKSVWKSAHTESRETH